MQTDGKVYLAVDIGASSGRVMAGKFDGERLAVEEVYRFENGPVPIAGQMHWDVLSQWSEIQEGLRSAAARFGDQIVSLGVDTWGVDFALLGHGDELLGNPYHYRDARTKGVMERAFQTVPRKDIFAATGLQFMEFNTLYQLLAMKESHSPLLDVAEDFLMIPDLFHWLMTGEKVNEITNATTTQFLDPTSGDWAVSLLQRFGLPTEMLGTLVPAGTTLGRLRSEVALATRLGNCKVVLPGTHDTASAVMAVPTAKSKGWCFISSGTWSLIGVERAKPLINQQCAALNYTNEGGVGGTIRLLQNTLGLWPIQECRRLWKERGNDYTWDELVQQARQASPLACFINPDDPRLLAPSDMPETIRQLVRENGQKAPDSHGALIRSVLESLAMRYRTALGHIESLTGEKIDTLHIVGGGAKNKLLSQMAADATGRQVVAGPVEATAIGNLMMQAVGAGDVANITQAREVIRRSFAVEVFEPSDKASWDDAYSRFKSMIEEQVSKRESHAKAQRKEREGGRRIH